MLDLSEENTLNFSEIVYAGQLDGQGGMMPIEDKAIADCGGTCWLHLDVEHRAVPTGSTARP
ncbi:Zinc transport protein ZntB [Sodalis glossinidius str. 'morsitans']|uniref:Zinc transport protein ZntB n=1 Tax=Sodalis glossinidius (strain morsitans) TaxID=343509 RepID=A0A193QK65_SODGM|nr:Zinc transport protein ZntB [Sodalis glossinidius str. 'morsitans']